MFLPADVTPRLRLLPLSRDDPTTSDSGSGGARDHVFTCAVLATVRESWGSTGYNWKAELVAVGGNVN